ncbi:MAG: ferredoxin family protein [Dehalococcoidia bacterium]|nr:ferredoxin family protein [Dehalococcoidia bacterium]
MTFVITDPCIGTQDQACVSVCPVDCIHFEEGKDQLLYINPAECIDCGACQPACPVSAIFPESDVPAEQRRFIEINSLWYEDPDGARVRVSGGAPAPAAAPVAVGAASAVEVPPVSADAAAPVEAAAAAPAAKPAAAAAPRLAMQVPVAPAHAPMASQYLLPPVLGVATLLLFILAFCAMVIEPGPAMLKFGDFHVGATVALLLPMALLLLLIFLASQWGVLALFAAKGNRRDAKWRRVQVDWRRNEESRRYNLVQVVEQIAAERFAYPDEKNPDLKTFVNLPSPVLAIEPRGTGEKLFPDIIAVASPGNVPVAVAQVESRETVTREQAMYVWAPLENQQTTLYLYVPAGSLARAKDYAKAAGIKKAKFRTWRWTPNGMVVKEA